ncbi:MAG: hypothetical protein QG594_2385 [Bacteroidota bacterium]|nr:hypothetical protein [Bacteroidota bacterium]
MKNSEFKKVAFFTTDNNLIYCWVKNSNRNEIIKYTIIVECFLNSVFELPNNDLLNLLVNN